MVKTIGKRAGLPAKSESYLCAFVGIEEADYPQYGAGWKWVFQVMGGEHSNAKVYRSTANSPTQGNSCGRFLGMLTGESVLAEGVEIDTDQFVGRLYEVFVEDTPTGTSTRIASFEPSDSGDTPF